MCWCVFPPPPPSACVCACVCVCLFVCLSVCRSVCMCLCVHDVHVCLRPAGEGTLEGLAPARAVMDSALLSPVATLFAPPSPSPLAALSSLLSATLAQVTTPASYKG
ncbi:MAG: hypothetical protein P4L40_02785 [Terracidiphilus sp.]|nr:hypothetical protein [Terracidiphilus sp.]